MKIKPEERTKTIALLAGIVLFLCVFGVRVIPRLLPHSPSGELLLGSRRTVAITPSSAAVVTPTLSTGAPSTAGTAPLAATSVAAPLTVPVATAADPFWRPLALSLQPERPGFAPVHTPIPGLVKNAKPSIVVGSGPMKLAPIAPPPMPEVALQGIVQDETAMAVLEIGGQARFLKAGETLEGGWVLKSIQTATVVLRQGRREVVLSLGQTLPKEAPPENHGGPSGLANTLPPFHNVTLAP